MGKALESSFGVAMQAARRDNFDGKEGFSLCNTAALKLIVSLTGYCKFFYRAVPLPYITAVLAVLYLLRLARPRVPFKVS